MGLMIHPKDKDSMFLNAIMGSHSISMAFVYAYAVTQENAGAQKRIRGIAQDFEEKYKMPIEALEPLVMSNSNARAFFKIGTQRILLLDVIRDFNQMRKDLLFEVLGNG